MEEINQFLEWAVETKKGLNNIISNIQNKEHMSDDDLILIEKLYRIYEEGTI